MSLLDELRTQIGDTRYSHAAFTLNISGDINIRATAEVMPYGRLVITVLEGAAPSNDIDFNMPLYNTVESLVRHLNSFDQYIISTSGDADLSHASTDIEPFGPIRIGPNTTGATFNTRLFSDQELNEVLKFAAKRHNPSFDVDTIPPSEENLVLRLAHAEVCRRQAMHGAKRRGLSLVVADLLALADNIEASYYADVSRNKKALHSPPEAPVNDMRDGDVVSGTLLARHARSSRFYAGSQNLSPAAPMLVDFQESDIEDTNLRVRWARNRDVDFYSYELWMSNVPEVARDKEYVTRLMANQAPLSFYERSTTSKLVYSSAASSHRDFDRFPVRVMVGAQGDTAFTLTELEPDTDYYFRLYVNDRFGEAVGSRVLHARTRQLRTILLGTDVRAAIPGTVVLMGTAGAPITTDVKLYVGTALTSFTVLTANSASFVAPSFLYIRQPKDLALVSPNGLASVLQNYFLVR